MKLSFIILTLFTSVLQCEDNGGLATLSTSSGRYVFGQVNHIRADQFMLDTKTGRLWHLGYMKDNRPILEPVKYFDYENVVPGEPAELFYTDTPEPDEAHAKALSAMWENWKTRMEGKKRKAESVNPQSIAPAKDPCDPASIPPGFEVDKSGNK